MRLGDECVSPSAEEFSIQPLTVKARCSRRASRRLLQLFPALLVLLAAVAVQGQQYSKIVVFGDSLSDTGNDSILMAEKYGFPFPSPYIGATYYGLYTLGEFTDGPYTYPASSQYSGVWVQQLAKTLPMNPPVNASLAGGTNYAYGDANTFDGTTVFPFTGIPFTITVLNVREQIEQYLATHPRIDEHTLFVVWGGANNLTEAITQPNASELIVNGAITQVGNIQRLIDAGATQFLVPNLPDLGLTPRFNTSPATSVPFHDATLLYNQTLDEGVSLLPLFNFFRHVTIHKLDVYGLMNQIVASPGTFGFSDVTDSSQSEPVNPDTYLFWDNFHPTTHGHYLLAQGALETIEPKGCLVPQPSGGYVGSAAPNCR